MTHRVLLATMNVGGGHTALMDSFARVLSEADPRGERFALQPRESRDNAIGAFYTAIVKHFAPVQGWLYNLSDLRPGNWVATRTAPHLLREAREMLTSVQPDFIICTHFLLSMQLARAKRALGMDAPLVAAIPDYGPTTHAFFPRSRALQGEHLVVMAEDTRRDLVETKGCDPARVHLSGFLTREPFAQLGRRLAGVTDLASERVSLRREARTGMPEELAGMDPARATVVFLGGSAWTLKTAPVIEALLAQEGLAERLNLVVVCGKDEDFAARMRARAQAGAKNLFVFGYVSADQMATLMGMADAPVLGSLAPASMQELMEVQSGPMLLYRFIPGAETPHPEYIQRHGLGLYEPDTRRMVRHLLEVVGLETPGERVRPLLDGYRATAAHIRSESRRRALELPAFLDGVLPARTEAVALPVPRLRTA